ncbi:MAG: hypothetical protein QW653_03680 [Candidatus Nitrosocaldus sp.]
MGMRMMVTLPIGKWFKVGLGLLAGGIALLAYNILNVRWEEYITVTGQVVPEFGMVPVFNLALGILTAALIVAGIVIVIREMVRGKREVKQV